MAHLEGGDELPMKKAATSWRPAAIAAGLPAATAGAERRLSSPAPLLLSDKAVRERLPRGAHPPRANKPVTRPEILPLPPLRSKGADVDHSVKTIDPAGENR